ncbi:MAG: TonB-dependent receptor plug domain-containing protein [Ferruginibacter sp.]
MRKIHHFLGCFLVFFLSHWAVNAQKVTISGNVRNSANKENVSAVSVSVKGSSVGSYTNDKGNFSLTVNGLPVTLVISSIGFESTEITVTSASALEVSLKPASTLGQEVVVSASRVPEKILESPVSIERVNAAAIRTAPGANYYDLVGSLRGVDVTTSSLTFKTPTTRGFNSSGNTRFNQLVDGMDNMAPGLNFSVASIIGLSELDVDNMELLSGASSALYGPGGMNGTLLLSSKNPFKYQGLSFIAKTGIMNTDGRQRDASPYHNWTLRWGKKVNDKFAFKLNAELIQAKDWLGFDDRNYARAATGGKVIAGTRASDPNYDGVNIYGDETTIDIRANVLRPIGATAAPFLANFIDTLNGGRAINVSRTGYTEKEIVNPNTVNFKLGGSLHYKLSSKTELIAAGYWGTGNTVYTGSERYSLVNFKMGQYKLELNNKDWMLRAFTTQENAGDSYNTTVATRLFNESWKPSGGSTGWYAQYAQAYLAARLNGLNDAAAHTIARSQADIGRPDATSSVFRAKYDSIRKRPISQGGARLLDKSDLYSVEGSYNLSKHTSKFADVLVGANFRTYVLNSEGTLFADKPDSAIRTKEYGAFMQLSRKLWNDRVKLTVSGRYDKNQNFKGRFTPRATAVFKVAEANHIRLSYQTAYRFPSNQQQWIDLAVGSNVRLLGSNEYFNTRYNLISNAVYDFESLRAGQKILYTPVQIKPEAITSYEAGYKGLLFKGKLLIDVYGYWGQYQDFIGRKIVVQNTAGAPISFADTSNGFRYSIPVNSTDRVKTYGFGASIDWRLPNNFSIGANIASDRLVDVPDNFVAYFNAPLYKANANIANTGFGPNKRLGFNVTYRWQQGFLYQGDFATGNLPDVHVVDAQVSFKLPKSKSILKLGANNLLNQYYYNAIGNSQVGGLYYISYGFNVY